MAEYINKAEAIKILCKGCNGCNPLDYPTSFCTNRNELVDMPTIDIVHCEECKKWDPALKVCKSYFIEDIVKSTNADWFCADGERKE